MGEIERIFPAWARSWGSLTATNALVRSQCASCGLQHRVDAFVQGVRFGAHLSPVDQLDRCSVVGCHGTVFYLTAKTYGRQWIALLSRPDRRDLLESGSPAANAVSLGLTDAGRPRGRPGRAQRN